MRLFDHFYANKTIALNGAQNNFDKIWAAQPSKPISEFFCLVLFSSVKQSRRIMPLLRRESENQIYASLRAFKKLFYNQREHTHFISFEIVTNAFKV